MGVNKILLTILKITFTVMIILLIVAASIRLCQTGYEYGYRFFTETPVDEEPGKDVIVQVKEGTSAMQLAQQLEQKGLVRDANLFYMRLELSAYRNSIKPGLYTLNTSMEPKEMMMIMSGSDIETTETEEATEVITEEETE